MVACSKIILVGLVIGAVVTFTSGDERNAQTKGETRRLNGAFIRRRRPATTGEGGRTPPYAVPMEPLIKYSQRDPLYDKLNRNKSTTEDISSRGDYLSAGSNNLAEVTAGPRLDQYGPPQYGPPQYSPPQYGPPPQYYQEPEPIIEIIIKESNESLPAPTQAPTPPPPPATREPIQVFYVKYKKNPNGGGYGESDVVYEPPVPALTQHESDAVEPDPDPQYPPFQHETASEQPYLPPPPSTTLRTIIRPDSETYHVPEGSSSGLKVTFSSSSNHDGKSDHELVESASEVEGRLPERQQRYQSQNVEAIDITTAKPHYFKRQQGPYFPPPPNPPNLQEFTPPPPGQFQNGLPQGRQPHPSHTTQAIYNQGNQQPSQFRPQQQAATFQRPQQFNPNQNSVNQPPNFQQRQPVRYNEPWQQGPNPNDYRARPPQQQNFEPQRRPQFQPTLEAQIEEYQRHKLFLHQQSLRQQSEQGNQALQQNFNRNPPQPIQNQNVQYQPLQPIHVQSAPQGIPFQRGPPNFNRQQFSSHQNRESVQNKAISQNFVTPQPLNGAPSFTPSNPVVVPDNSKPFVPSPQHNPQNQQVFTQPSQPSFTKPEVQTSNPGIDYSGRNRGFSRPQPIYNDAEFVKTISPIEDIDIKSDGESGNKVPGDEQEKGSTESSQELSTEDRAHSALSALANHKIAPQTENHRYEQSHSSTTPNPRPTYYSTTSAPNTSPDDSNSNQPSSTQAPSSYEEEKKEEETAEEVQKKKANLAALPDEVPDDLREQLLSSGILGNADIQILDYDKVGDIPIESLPPEALENLYGAGSEQVATVVKPDGTPDKKSVEMKVVRFDPNTKEGQGLADTYLREDATQLDPVVLNDSRYNRYLPLKIRGTNFPLPDIPQLKNKVVNSVVVLAPVDYDFIKTQDDVDRASRTIQVEGVRFIAGDSLKTLVRDPSLTNYNKWLDVEKDTPSGRQSVVLLVTSPTSTEKSPKSSKMEIFMYDVATAKVSKLRGELSSTFVEVAESNSGSEELEELAGTSSEETTQSNR